MTTAPVNRTPQDSGGPASGRGVGLELLPPAVAVPDGSTGRGRPRHFAQARALAVGADADLNEGNAVVEKWCPSEGRFDECLGVNSVYGLEDEEQAMPKVSDAAEYVPGRSGAVK